MVDFTDNNSFRLLKQFLFSNMETGIARQENIIGRNKKQMKYIE